MNIILQFTVNFMCMIQVKNCVSEHNYWILIIISHSAEESYFNKNQKKKWRKKKISFSFQIMYLLYVQQTIQISFIESMQADRILRWIRWPGCHMTKLLRNKSSFSCFFCPAHDFSNCNESLQCEVIFNYFIA